MLIMKKLLGLFLLLTTVYMAKSQYTSLNAHSHNDYAQKTPFFLAYNAHFGSIEADIWAVNGDLFVAHDKAQITSERSLESLYLLPIVKLFRENGGKAWKDSPATFQLLIDLKTEVEPTLPLLVKKLMKYPEVFDPSVNKNAVHVTITGNRPEPAKFKDYPDFIFFDGNLNLKYDTEQLKRVALYSDNLVNFTRWRGTEAIPAKVEKRLVQVIDSVHGINKTIRFWNAPDTPDAWRTLMKLKVNYINTDHIQELESFLKNSKN
jgi:alkaline phosphatase